MRGTLLVRQLALQIALQAALHLIYSCECFKLQEPHLPRGEPLVRHQLQDALQDGCALRSFKFE